MKLSKTCKLAGCRHILYSKGYCVTHYRAYRKKRSLNVIKKCKKYGCNNKVYWSKSGYCKKHRHRGLEYRQNVPWLLSSEQLISKATKGAKNYNWKGGIAQYKDHYKLKKARLEKIKEEQGLCELCKLPASKVKHIDNDKSNYRKENLKLLCDRCFGLSIRKPKEEV